MREKILKLMNKVFLKKLDCQQCEKKKCVIYDGDIEVRKEWKGTLKCTECNAKFI